MQKILISNLAPNTGQSGAEGCASRHAVPQGVLHMPPTQARSIARGKACNQVPNLEDKDTVVVCSAFALLRTPHAGRSRTDAKGLYVRLHGKRLADSIAKIAGPRCTLPGLGRMHVSHRSQTRRHCQSRQRGGSALHKVQQRQDVHGGRPLDLHLEAPRPRRLLARQLHLRACARTCKSLFRHLKPLVGNFTPS